MSRKEGLLIFLGIIGVGYVLNVGNVQDVNLVSLSIVLLLLASIVLWIRRGNRTGEALKNKPPQPHNVVEQVELKTGWLDVFESEERAIERATKKLNEDGYRVVLVSKGDFSAAEGFTKGTMTVFTLGFYRRKPSVLLVAEKIRR